MEGSQVVECQVSDDAWLTEKFKGNFQNGEEHASLGWLPDLTAAGLPRDGES
jgi:hypothetical protein